MKTFQEFLKEAYLIEGRSREDAEKLRQSRDNPEDWVLNNTASSENPNWTLKSKEARSNQAKERAERIKALNTPEERSKANKKTKRAQRMGYEGHHITPIHHSAKLKASMSDAEWKARKERDAKLGIYHGHHPKNIMHVKGPKTPAHKSGVHHRAGGAHEIEGKVKDIVSGPGSKETAIGHRDLLAAAVKKQRREKRQEGKK